MWKERAGCSSFYRLLTRCSIKASCRLLSQSLFNFFLFSLFLSVCKLHPLWLHNTRAHADTHARAQPTCTHAPDSTGARHIRLLCAIKVHSLSSGCFCAMRPQHSKPLTWCRSFEPSRALYLSKIDPSQGGFQACVCVKKHIRARPPVNWSICGSKSSKLTFFFAAKPAEDFSSWLFRKKALIVSFAQGTENKSLKGGVQRIGTQKKIVVLAYPRSVFQI